MKHSPLELLAYQRPDLWLTGRRVRECAWTGAHCAVVLCFHPGFLSCSILRCIAFGQASYSALSVRGSEKPQIYLHEVTSPSLLKDANVSQVRQTFEAAIVIVIWVEDG